MIGRTMGALRFRFTDPGRAALKKAARAAIVIPVVFAFADKVVQQPQSTFLASLGSFAVLVLADFRGPPRGRLVAYVALFAAGAAFVTLGTLCSQNVWLGAAVMGVVGFVVLFSSAINPYFAMAGWAPLLTFVLPVTLPAEPSAIPMRLEGWALACAVGIPAALLLWPPRPRSVLGEAAARACRTLADLLSAELDADTTVITDRADAARADVAAVRWTFVSTPYRPTGATGATEALAFLVDALEWFLSISLPEADRPDATSGPCADENRAVLAAVSSVLRDSAATLEGGNERPDLARLDAATDVMAGAFARDIAQQPAGPDDGALVSAVEPSFRTREMSVAARAIGLNALRATGLAAPEFDALSPRSALDASRIFARGYGSVRSALLRNSIRGAVALALAVLIALETGLQHGFWVVLGTLSVLRSNALGTGSSVVTALLGTSLGLLIGVGLVLAAGTDEGVLWALLPVAVLLAAYAPQAISFAAGQAGFTVTLLILFNLIQPTGWTVGLVRIEDVAIGFAVSLGVGALFWPRGAGALMRRSLATAYTRGAEYLGAAVHEVIRGADATGARRQARAAADRLDDAFRQYLSELSGNRSRLEDVARLLAGATRLRLTAYSLSTLAGLSDGSPGPVRVLRTLDEEGRRLSSWYLALGDSIVDARMPPAPDDSDRDGPLRRLGYAREPLARDSESSPGLALMLLWASQHLANLRRLELDLIGPAGELAGHPPEKRYSEGPGLADRSLRATEDWTRRVRPRRAAS
jgi:uncharacterized membrane protein YccC